MALKFTQVDEKWVAEFSVTDDFNLHIEREESGYLIVNQRTTAEGKYDSIRDGSFNYGDPVVDIYFTGVIYPKYIQVISKVEPTYAEVTSNGEVEQMGGGGFEFTVFDVGTEQNITCSFEDGMTWRQWVESDYNTINLAVQGNFIVSADNPTYLVLNVGDESEGYIQENVHPDDLIIATDKYVNRFMG